MAASTDLNRIHPVLRRTLAVAGISMLVAAMVGHLPGAFYHWLRWVVCLIGCVLAGSSVARGAWGMAAALLGAAVLFNPVWPFWIGRTWWLVADAVVVLMLVMVWRDRGAAAGRTRSRPGTSSPAAGGRRGRRAR